MLALPACRQQRDDDCFLLPHCSVEFPLEPRLLLGWYLGVFPDCFPGLDETSLSLAAGGTRCSLCASLHVATEMLFCEILGALEEVSEPGCPRTSLAL